MAEAKAKKTKESAEKKPALKKTTKAVKPVEKEVIDGTIPQSSEPTVQATEEQEVKEVKTAKAGKRSAKAVGEVEAAVAKEERKAARAEDEESDKPKHVQKPARTLLERRSKNYQKAAGLVDKTKSYSLSQALELATKTSLVKFDATVELHIRLSVDPRHADQNIRDIVLLPAGTGKTVCVAVFADVADVAIAKKAGADIAASEEFLQQLEKGKIDFDVLIATPAMMPKLGKFARVLGPKGLMPNPKSGTVTTDVAKAVTEAKAGRVEYRVDSTGIIHVGVGKVSFGTEKLVQNTRAILNSIKAAKPASVKSAYVKAVHITTSMGPSITVENSEV